MALMKAYRSLNFTKDLTLTDGDGNTVTPGVNDKLRIAIGHVDDFGSGFAGAKFSLTSGTASANGSTITLNSPSSGVNRLNIKPEDLDFDPGVYTMVVEYFDNADSEWKPVDRQVFHLSDS